MIENQVENYLIKKVSALGGKAWKFVSPGNAGVPDRLITYNSRAFFVEVKRPGGKPRALQKATVAQIRATGMESILHQHKGPGGRINKSDAVWNHTGGATL